MAFNFNETRTAELFEATKARLGITEATIIDPMKGERLPFEIRALAAIVFQVTILREAPQLFFDKDFTKQFLDLLVILDPELYQHADEYQKLSDIVMRDLQDIAKGKGNAE